MPVRCGLSAATAAGPCGLGPRALSERQPCGGARGDEKWVLPRPLLCCGVLIFLVVELLRLVNDVYFLIFVVFVSCF